MSYNSKLKEHKSLLQEILEDVNALPEANTGIELPKLTNEGVASDLLSGKQLIDDEGNPITGTMKNNGAVNASFDGINTTSYTVPAGYTSGGRVSLTNDIPNEVATQEDIIDEILTALEGKVAGGSGNSTPTLQNKTVNPSTNKQTITADNGYDGLSSVTVNAMTTATQATPSITVNSSGLITATATQTAGYVSAGSKSATKQLTTQAAQTITPSTNDKTITSGKYLTGTQTIKGDANLVASNIKSGVSIFGVTGSYEGSGGSGETNGIETVNIRLISVSDSEETAAHTPLIEYGFSTYENGRIGFVANLNEDGWYEPIEQPFDITIPNVICDSAAYIEIGEEGFYVLSRVSYDSPSGPNLKNLRGHGYSFADNGDHFIVESNGLDTRNIYISCKNDD